MIEFTAIAAILTLAGATHSIIGFGFGIVALAFLPNVIDVRMAHIVLSLSSVPVLATAAWAYRKGINWRSLRPALIGSALLMPVGLMAFKWMSMDLLIRGTGLAILLTTLNSLRSKKLPDAESEPTSPVMAFLSPFLAGGLSGFLGGAVSIAGPPVATYALNQGWKADRFKTFVSQCLLVICLYKTAGLAIGDLIEKGDAVRALWATPFSLIGIRLGVWLSRFIDPKRFQVLVAIVLIAIACFFLYRGSPSA